MFMFHKFAFSIGGSVNLSVEYQTIQATPNEDGFYQTDQGDKLEVSASDLEKFTYCPLSWALSKSGVAGQGHSILQGVERNEEISKAALELTENQIRERRNLEIWTWWVSVVVILCIDGFVFLNVDNIQSASNEVPRYLALWALSSLILAIFTITLPWRSWVNLETTKPSEPMLIEPIFEPPDFIGGWFEGGRIESALLFGSIILALHSIALQWADDKEKAAFILVVTALVWTLFSTYRLKKALIAHEQMIKLSTIIGIDLSTQVVYSDSEESSEALLIDSNTGLRGRPNQIVIIDQEFIPVEQKSGRPPKVPHESHKVQILAYLKLVESSTQHQPSYGVINYGNEKVFKILWNQENRELLESKIKAVQEAMVTGGAHRNHERVGKCNNCSRAHACPERLT
jgi:CRISPR-associated exonuclease Cas4